MKFEHTFEPTKNNMSECMGDCYFTYNAKGIEEKIHFMCMRSEYEMLVSFIETIVSSKLKVEPQSFPNSNDFPSDYTVVTDGKIRISDYFRIEGVWRHPSKRDYATIGNTVTSYECVIRKKA